LDTYGSLFEKILLARYVSELSELGLICDEPFGFRPKYDTSLQLVHLNARVTMKFGDKSLTGIVFFDVAKAVDTVWIDDLFYEIGIFNFHSA